MNKFLVIAIFATILLGSSVLLVRSGRLANPIETVETDSEVFSVILGTVNDFLGFDPGDHEEEEPISLEEDFARSGYPAELFSFDVTKQKASFGVVSSNPSAKSLILRYSFPFVQRGKVIEASIDCPLSDSKIVVFDSVTQEVEETLAEKPLYEIVNPEKDGFQGVCGDESCSSIVLECELVRDSRDISEIQPNQ